MRRIPMIASMYTLYACTTNMAGDVTSGNGAARIGPYGLVANPGAERQLCGYYLE
jgi:hypothetical protein